MKSRKEIADILLGTFFNMVFMGFPIFSILDMRTWESMDLFVGIGFIVMGCLYLARIHSDIDFLTKRVEELENKK